VETVARRGYRFVGEVEKAVDDSSLEGTTLSHYRILEKLGEGGMGVVWRAHDPRLNRAVAIKISAEKFSDRFEREARAIAALNHPNICTLYDVGPNYLVMELIEGESPKGPLPVEDGLRIARQIADALDAAHEKGIVHRDLKPGNIKIRPDGTVKVLDFGLAKTIQPPSGDPQNSPTETVAGVIMGTAAYMSPEQARGQTIDKRTDIWAFGVVLYELLTGHSPFRRESTIGTIGAVVHEEPAPLREFVKDAPSEVEAIIRRCLRKNPEERYASMEEVGRGLENCCELASQPIQISPRLLLSQIKRPRIAILLVAILLALGALGGWGLQRILKPQWARNQIPEIQRLLDADEFVKAAALARRARAILPADPALAKLWMQTTGDVSFTTTPSEAEVAMRPYSGDPNVWEPLGKTPLKNVRVPRNAYIFRITKPGFVPVSAIGDVHGPANPGYITSLGLSPSLRPEGTVPPDMVVAPAGRIGLGYPTSLAPLASIDQFLIDRNEVTNEQYKKFVGAGGYQKREFWKQPFVKDGKAISWEEAIAFFRDATGRPGPATWEVGSYPKGKEQHPVAGVSWYEAAAYAEFVGKSLPTAYHWTRAATTTLGAIITPGSNFQGEGTQRVGSSRAISGWGTTDMAGNVKEWCLNEGRAGMRFILGGGFGEPPYMFSHTDQQPPWDRRPNFGFRCVKLDSPPSAEAAARIEQSHREFSQEKPVSDEVFKAYKAMYAYDKTDLDARVEETETTENWTRQKISFNAAYGRERVTAHLYVPKHGSPPFQAIVYFPGATAPSTDKLDLATAESSDTIDFLLKSGRALIFPIYKGFYERRDGFVPGRNPPAFLRDHVIAWSKDLGRSIDYLETRKDIDATKVGYWGASLGGTTGPLLAAVESRIKVMILFSGGFHQQVNYYPREADTFNFAPHVTIPVLMLNGRYDQTFPLEGSQLPMFRGLGTKDKKHVIYEGGHAAFPRPAAIRESLDWLDKYLGLVER
jgi:formylglycine-generating enzyme required for sulfatase activity/predicted Ser/Thr protein kinase